MGRSSRLPIHEWAALTWPSAALLTLHPETWTPNEGLHLAQPGAAGNLGKHKGGASLKSELTRGSLVLTPTM